MCDDNGWSEFSIQERMLIALCERLERANLAALISEDENLALWWEAHQAEERLAALHHEQMRIWQQHVFRHSLGGEPPAYLIEP